MEKEIEKDTFDINTIGLYDAEKDRKWKERAKMEYAYQKGFQEGYQEEYKKGYEEGLELGRREAISKMLNYGLTLEEISRMINISLEDVKRMSQL